MKTKPGTMSSSRHRVLSVNQRSEEFADLHSLSTLAGLNIPLHTLSILIQLLKSGVSPATLYILLRHIAKHSSRQEQSSRQELSNHASRSSRASGELSEHVSRAASKRH
ncbi:hypothetical protein B566_EDAN007860 [Ephemera danica]|nr:hypothetical protein B566_EDAN007860 [Ephemera danica]